MRSHLTRCVALIMTFAAFRLSTECKAQDVPAAQSAGGNQRVQQWRERAIGTLKEALAEPLPDDAEQRAQSVRMLGSRPFAVIEKRVLELLEDPAPQVRIAAGEILTRQSRDRHARAVLRALRDLRPENEPDRVRQVIALLNLGEPGMLEQLRDWGTLRALAATPGNQWICPFHPQIVSGEKGRCPICAIELTPAAATPSRAARDAQMLALAALAARNDPLVPNVARELLTGEAESSVRQHAAIQWARVAPEEALPHLRIFLLSPDGRPRPDTLYGVAHFAAEHMVPELERIAEDRSNSWELRVTAIRGLVSAGRTEYLEPVRRLLAEDTDPDQLLGRANAIDLVGDFGTHEDLPLLAPYLTSDLRIFAANAIVRLLGSAGM